MTDSARPFRKVLVANRAEIAVRVIRACRDLGIASVAVYSDIDRAALHVRLADEAYPIGAAPPAESYLNIERVVAVGKRSGCDAVHPGYGFLAESAAFAQAVADAGLVFVGPPASVQRALGEKTSARRIARDAGVPVAEGALEPLADLAAARALAARVGYPVMLKPARGGGGKGLRHVASEVDLADAWRAAASEARSAFGDGALLLERLVEHARHVEVQVLADERGDVVWLGERDCSIQRRHQKLIEESPGPSVDEALRARLGEVAVAIARAAAYRNAGTAEFLVDGSGAIFFLEMNTRLQVEHPVTEAVTGLDLVALQLRLAAGEPLPFGQGEVARRGAAIELRITAEDPYRGFVPYGGAITALRLPGGPGVRVDHALEVGTVVPTEYDPLLAKVIASGADRAQAIARARRALTELVIGGVPTSTPFHRHALEEPDFLAARHDTGYVAAHWPPPAPPGLDASAAAAAAYVAVCARTDPARLARLDGARDSAWSRRSREEALR